MNLSLQKNFEQIAKLSAEKLGMKKPTKQELERQELLHHLEETNREIEDTMMRFNNATEQCLIDMYTYEIKSLEQKYSFYLSRVRGLDSQSITG